MELKTLKTIFDTFYHRTYIPVSILDKDHKLCFPRYSPLYNHLDKFDYLLKKDEFPIHIINTYQNLMASFYFENYIILIGPCFLSGARQDTHDIFNQYKTYLSTESLNNFGKTISMLYTLLTHKEININNIPIKYIRLNDQVLGVKKSYEKNVYLRRLDESTRDSYQFELRFLEYVKNGQKDKIDWIFSQINKTYLVKLGDSSLDTIKIKFISLVTLMTRLAINTGVPLENSFSLSDTLIQNLPNIKSYNEGIEYIKYASYEFINLIKSTSIKCSALINHCINYIDTHIYEKITLQDLSNLTGNSTVYISTMFKKELNTSFSQYLLKRKIEEAKHLLLYTDYSFQEISTLLTFTSQSHFTQRFKQVTKQTPKEFRDANFQYM